MALCSASQPRARAGIGEVEPPGIIHLILGDNNNESAESPNTIPTDHSTDMISRSSRLLGQLQWISASQTPLGIRPGKLL